MTTHRVVVGFDGSEDAIRAVRWAVDHAAGCGAQVAIVHAYDYPYLEQLDDDAQQTMHDRAQSVARSIASEHRPGVAVTAGAMVGDPAEVLIAAAHDADLLVVGDRGANAMHRWLLGSVATKCVHHAPCPVAVIRGPHED